MGTRLVTDSDLIIFRSAKGYPVSGTGMTQYDARGRVTSVQQTTKRPEGTTLAAPASTYGYWADGTVASVGYPSGKQVVNCYDGLGRPLWVSASNTTGDCSSSGMTMVSGGYVQTVEYWPHGAVKQMTLGNGAVETAHYNERLQPDLLELTKGSSLWKQETAYTSGTRRNVGNVLKQTQAVPGASGSLATGYVYDKADRLTRVTEQPSNADDPQCGSGNSGAWCMEYGLDGYGNRRLAQQIPSTADTTRVPQGFSTATNRISDAGWVYNDRGDLTKNAAGEQMAYDAEGRLTAWCGAGQLGQACGVGAGQVWTARFVYDAEGRRVRKDAAGTSEYSVYGARGELLADYGGPPAEAGLRYLTADALGSTRVQTDASGGVKNRWDYEPYGVLIGVPGTGSWRSGIAGYGNVEGTKLRFTGKERDAETGLDYFGARYFSSAQGRFTSTDPFNVIDLAKSRETAGKFRNYLSNPQHWNKYAYVLNNPLRYTDPLGLLEYDTELLHKKIHVHIDDNLSDKRQNELKGKLDSAIKNINDNENKLTANQTKVLGHLKSIDVDSSAKRSYSIESKGAFTLTPDYVDKSSTPWLGSAVGHDAFHMEQFKLGGIGNSRGVQAEKGAFVFQLDFGLKIGIAPFEADYLKDLINDPKKLEQYYNSPIK